MKRSLILIAFALAIGIVGCQKESNDQPASAQAGASTSPTHPGRSGLARVSGTNYSHAIKKDTANRMINSYLTSINYTENDSTLRSLSFDADTMRAYLADSRIVTLQFRLAHQLSYINSNKYGVSCGMKANALTFVIVGLDDNNAVIYNNRNMVYDNSAPCPSNCPTASMTLP